MEKKKKSRVALRVLCEGALMVALAQILSYLKLWELPQGGSVTIGMFPIFLFCIRWGFGPGMLASVVFSVLQLVLDGAYAYSWQSMLGDYIVAFSVLGVAGRLFPGQHRRLRRTVPGPLDCRCNGLGRIHAGSFLWYDDDISVVLLRVVQW